RRPRDDVLLVALPGLVLFVVFPDRPLGPPAARPANPLAAHGHGAGRLDGPGVRAEQPGRRVRVVPARPDAARLPPRHSNRRPRPTRPTGASGPPTFYSYSRTSATSATACTPTRCWA